jgi:hypothetical protein
MSFPGGKAMAGTYQRLINQIPPHRVYVEPFLGGGAILRYKLPAERSIAIDLDPSAIERFGDRVPAATTVLNTDGLAWLEENVVRFAADWFVYLDPPYMQDACQSRLRYKYVLSREDHGRLLRVARAARCNVMLSGYWSELYARELRSWRSVQFWVMTRGGHKQMEWVWMNYAQPDALHDYRYLGRDYREREKFVRQRRRWVNRLQLMDRLRRLALVAAMGEVGMQEE